MSESYTSHIESFLNYLRYEKRYSERTSTGYETNLIQFFDYCTTEYDSPNISEITHQIIRSWLGQLKSKEDNCAGTIKGKISTLKTFFKFLMIKGIIKNTPMTVIISPKLPKRLPSFVSENDIQTLFTHVEFTDDWKGKTDRLVLELFYATGMRLSELINLQENQIDAYYKQLKILGKGNKERIVPLNTTVLAALQEYITQKPVRIEGVGNIFITPKGNPLYKTYVYHLVKNNLQKVTTINKKSPHVLRHTFATHLTNNGADLNAIKELLGHASLASTQVYTHNSIEKLKDAFKKAHPKA